MASAGPSNPTAAANDATTGTATWTNPTNVENSGTFATALNSFTTASLTEYCLATGFGFSIPGGATVFGIAVSVMRYSSLANGVEFTKDNSVRLTHSGAGGYVGNDYADTTDQWPTSAAAATYGGPTDLWGTTWTPSQINSSNFGLGFSAAITGHTAICLAPDTLISAPIGPRPIQELSIGDKVLSFDTTTGSIQEDVVTAVQHRPISNYGNRYFVIHTDDGSSVRATFNHGFYASGEWKQAATLQIGETLVSDSGKTLTITDIEIQPNTEDEVWDISVQTNHNFFANGTLVHNITTTANLGLIQITVYYGPNSYSITASQGSISLSGETTALAHLRSLILSFGSFVLSGIVATIKTHIAPILVNRTKHAATLSNASKHAATPANKTKHSATITNAGRHSVSAANQTKHAATMTNAPKN